MKCLVIIPCYNEEKTILKVARDVEAHGFDYLVINDGSTDNSLDVLKANKLTYLNNPTNLGLTETFRLGIKYAKENNYEGAIQFDGDGQHLPKYLTNIREQLKSSDIVIGSRFLNKKTMHQSLMKKISANLIIFFVNYFGKIKITDPTSGLRGYNKNVFKYFIHNQNITPEPTMLMIFGRNKFAITEIDVEMQDREHGESYLNTINAVKYMINELLSIFLLKHMKLMKGEK